MQRLWSLKDLTAACAIGFAVYTIVHLGPYEVSLLAGRSLRIFLVAVQGYV